MRCAYFQMFMVWFVVLLTNARIIIVFSEKLKSCFWITFIIVFWRSSSILVKYYTVSWRQVFCNNRIRENTWMSHFSYKIVHWIILLKLIFTNSTLWIKSFIQKYFFALMLHHHCCIHVCVVCRSQFGRCVVSIKIILKFNSIFFIHRF